MPNTDDSNFDNFGQIYGLPDDSSVHGSSALEKENAGWTILKRASDLDSQDPKVTATIVTIERFAVTDPSKAIDVRDFNKRFGEVRNALALKRIQGKQLSGIDSMYLDYLNLQLASVLKSEKEPDELKKVREFLSRY